MRTLEAILGRSSVFGSARLGSLKKVQSNWRASFVRGGADYYQLREQGMGMGRRAEQSRGRTDVDSSVKTACMSEPL